MRRLVFILIFVATSISLFSQKGTIRGNVFDKESGDAISFAVVSLGGDKLITTTDIDGFFNITDIKEGDYTLTIKFIGYKTYTEDITITGDNNAYKRIFMTSESVVLKSIDISAHKQRKKSETYISKLEITPKQLKSMPAIGGEADVVQYLQTVPGIISTGDQGGQLYIRGGSPVQNKIMLDGLTILNPFHSIGSFSVFETEALKNINVVTGGFNAEQSGRISAIVDIKTKDGNKKRISGSVSASPFVAKALLEGPIIKFSQDKSYNASFLLTGKRSIIDKTDDVFYNYIVSKDKAGLPYVFSDLYGKISMNFGGGSKINIFGFNFDDNYKNPKVASLGWNNIGGGMNIKIVPGSSNMIIEALFGYSNYSTEAIDFDEKRRFSQMRDFTSKFDFNVFGNGYKIGYGIEINALRTNFTFDNIFKQNIKEVQNTTNIRGYFKFRKKWGNLIIEPGTAIAYYASLGDLKLEPRLTFKYNVNTDLRIKGAAGMYTQSIISASNDKDVINYFIGFVSSPEEQVYSFLLGKNTKDKLQSAKHAILGVEFDLLDNLEINVEGYYKDFGQLVVINRDKRSYSDPNYVVETGSAYGIDFSSKYESKNIYLWLSYSYGFVDRNDGEQIYPTVYDRRHNVNFMANYNFGKDYSWQLGVRWNLGSGFPFTKTQGFYNHILFEDGADTDYTTENPSELGVVYSKTRNGGRLPYYHRLDISLQKTIEFNKNSSLELTASVVNVYNRKNIFYFDRIAHERVNQLPILPAFGLKYNF